MEKTLSDPQGREPLDGCPIQYFIRPPLDSPQVHNQDKYSLVETSTRNGKAKKMNLVKKKQTCELTTTSRKQKIGAQ